ncbi:Actin-like protein [Perkinsela sp. CCAP 1560/4]|nr:Actin-like protein [Perkinsela sp. CCAP 1560/4]|eukprot:KNH06074.1 Actin-like protein [Perkinsela sp. CCAP 1560/4]
MIIIDNGAYCIRAIDTANKASAVVTISNMRGRLPGRHSKDLTGADLDSLKGKQCDGLRIERPLSQGLLVDVQLQQSIWKELLCRIQMRDRKVVFTAPLLTPSAFRPLYETLIYSCGKAESARIVSPSYLIARSHDEAICIVVDIGFHCTWITPYIEYLPVKQAVRRVDIGGDALTAKLQSEIWQHQKMLRRNYLVANNMKHACCYVALDFEEATRRRAHNNDQSCAAIHYSCSNEKICNQENEENIDYEDTVTLLHEPFCVPEILFQPFLVKQQGMGIGEALMESIGPFHPAVQRGLLNNILLTGETSQLNGLVHRLERDISSLAPYGAPVRIINMRMCEAIEKVKSGCLFTNEEFVHRDEFSRNLVRAREKLWSSLK